MSAGHALLSVNGETSRQVLQSLHLPDYSVFVAVDGGLRHLQQLGVTPDYLIGDLDSVDPKAFTTLQESGVQVLQHPTEKDLTDLELALNFVSGLSIDKVTLLGLDGGRADHALANLLLLGKPDWTFEVRFVSPYGNGFVITPEHALREEFALKTELSLLPLTPRVEGVDTNGLYYPLSDHTIALGSTLGISNVVTQSSTTVTVKAGKLLAVHTAPDNSSTTGKAG